MSKTGNKSKEKLSSLKRKFSKKFIILSGLLFCLSVGSFFIARNTGAFSNGSFTFGLTNPKPTPIPQPAKPKRNTKTKVTSVTSNGAIESNREIPGESILAQVLASTDFNLIGLVGTVTPTNQTVPKNIPTAVLTSIQVPEGEDPATIISQLNPNYRIRGELTGPSFTSPRMVEAPIGQQISIPPMPNAGDHVIQNLRIIDITDPTNSTLAPVTPDSVGISVIENILITQVQVNEMTYEQIVQSGININNGSYNYYNFIIGLATSSGTVPIQIPVALPSTGGQPPVIGNPTGGVGVNGVSVPIPDIIPVMLEGVDENGNNASIPLPGGETMQIPGVVVFPGRIGLLHQFFEAIVIVANGAPNGTPLVITNLRAKANLPDAGTPNDISDDPLRIAETQQGGVQTQLEIHGLGPDGVYGTADDTTSFSPGQSGQATFLVEGLKEGLHTVDFNLEGTLQGLPGGNMTVRGTVPGAVLVRDAEFGVTFTHPSVVRAGQEYDLGLTIFNSGNRNLNGIVMSLRGDSVSGAELIDSEDKTLTQTIPPGGSGTVKWRLRSNTTGQVTASYVKVGEGIDAGLNLITGVGDRNVPLSPDSLILPDPVNYLPPDVVEAARQMLGQAWSVATAPSGSLPNGVLPIDKQTVVGKAVELGWAGLRIEFHEDRDTSLRTLMRDWLGENQSNSSTGFADALRNTPAGYYFFDVVGTKFFESLTSASPGDFHKKLIDAESSRSAFVSAFVSQTGGQQILGAKINSPTGQSVGFGTNANERFGDLRTGASLNLLQTDPHDTTNNTRGNLLLVSKPANGNWSLELNGWADGTTDVSILAPTSGKNYRQLVFSNLVVTAGKRYRITFRSSGTTTPVIEEYINGAFRSVNIPFTSYDISDPNPVITGVVQVSNNVIEGGDRFGRLVGVLFSKPMVKSSVETATRYQIIGGELVSDNSRIIGKLIKPTSAIQNFGERFVILGLDGPIGPFIKRSLTVNGIVDKSGKVISNSTQEIEMHVSPLGIPAGAYMTGRVMQADGTPVSFADVYYRRLIRSENDPCGDSQTWETIGYQKADSNGEFVFDYVREEPCNPVTVFFQNPATNSNKTIISNIAYHGQHLIFNAVFLARGNVQGTVTSGGVPLANANVSILSELDPLNSKLVRTNAQGFYSATGVPVGGLTVKAVGTGNYSLSSGISAGNLGEPGGTVTIDVSTQNISGVIKGKVVDQGNNQAPVPNSLVVAKAFIPGFPSNEPIPVGYAFTNGDGNFTIERLPIGNVFVYAVDPQRGVSTSTTVQLTAQNKQVENVILSISNGFGRISGRVLNEIGQPIPNAVVQEGAQAVRADSSGNYTLPQTREGNANITATDPVTRLTGSTVITVRRNEDTNGADIVIRRPAFLNGQVFVSENGTTTPIAGAYVSTDGLKIVKTDAQGRYTLDTVESGRNLTIRFVHPQGRLFVNTNVFLNPGETLSRNATFKSGRIHGKITQPDGVTPVLAGVYLKTVKPHFNQDIFFGLPEETTYTYQTNTTGLYSFESLNPVEYRVSTSNVFFPVSVSKSGTLPPNGNLEINLSLVDTLAGKVQGHIYQPDGVTPVGAGVKVSLGGGSLADVTVRTNEEGYYEFAEVFAEGSYTLTATDPLTNRTNRTGVQVKQNEDMVVDLRLLGRGKLKVKVVDGGGLPVPNGTIRVEGSNYPNDRRFVELTAGSNGEFEFAELTEGNYAVSALYLGLGGRVSAKVTLGGITEVTVQVQAVGTITGRVFMPDGTTPVGLADVRLTQGGRTIGLITTQDSDEERGKFSFDYVPTGEFTIEVFDNRTGRKGRAAGSITQQGQNAEVTVNLLALGTVVGRVTSNGLPADHALVRLNADGSGIDGTSRVATTDSDGRFRFPGIPVGRVNITVSNGPGGTTGQSQGTVSGTIEPLPDTVIDVVLTPTAAVVGTVYKLGGSEVYPGASVRVTSNNFSVNTTTDTDGKYRVNYVPLGTINVRVEAPFGYDRGKSTPVISNQPGATVTSDVTMTGVGTINGIAFNSNGSPLAYGKVTFTNSAWNETISVVTPVQPDGTYSMAGLPTGDFNLKLTVPEIIGVGTATDNLSGGQSLTRNLQLESAGKVFGSVRALDGTSPAVGADVVLTLAKQGGGNYTFVAHTDSNGNWEFSNLPLGTINIYITDANSDGVARILGLNLDTNGQEINTGTVVLDNAPIAVESVNPGNGAINVPRNTAVQILFSEAVDPTTITSGSVRLKNGNSTVSATRTISADGKTVTLTPNQILADSIFYTVEVTTAVKDTNGIALIDPFISNFTTADETPPVVVTIIPANNAEQVPLTQNIEVTFDEALGENQQFSDVVKVAPQTAPGSFVGGNYNINPNRKTVIFTPSVLVANVRYKVTVNGQKDLFGNTQTNAVTSLFTTIDNNPPALYDFTIDNQILVEGLIIENQRPRFYIYYSDDIGINTAATKLYLAKQGETLEAVSAAVTQNNLSYQPLQALEAGQYITKVVVTDTAGNVSSTPEVSFTINPQIPEIHRVYPNYGVTTGNDVVTVTGKNLITQFNVPDESARGLLGEYSETNSYYNDPPTYVVRTDNEINFDFMGERMSPYFVNYGNEKVTWKGKIIPLYSEDYTFTFELSGGVKVYIGENLVIDSAASEAVRQVSGNIPLEAGQPYDIRIEHFGYYGYPHLAKLFWSSPSQTQEIVPQEQLRPAPQAVAPTVLFGGSAATVIGAVSDPDEDIISVLTPEHIVGTVNVDVQRDSETVSLADSFTYYEDEYPPYAQIFSPSGVSNISPPNRITVSFNEPLATAQDFNTILRVFNATTEYIPIAGNVTLDETHRKLTFIPSVPLAEDTRYVIAASNQSDVSGNINTSEYSQEFSTTDRSAPEIYYVMPEDQSTVFDRNPSIAAYFQDSLSSIDSDASIMILDGTDVSAQAQKYYSAIQYTPPTPLALGPHTVTFKVFDENGNSAEKTSSFTIEADTQPPVINDFRIDNKPAVDGVQTRYRMPVFYINFSDNGPITNSQQKVYLGPQGGAQSPVTTYVYGNGNGSWSVYGYTQQNLDFGFYTVRVDIIDKAGNTISRSVNFELIDLETVPPQVTGVNPAYNAREVAVGSSVIVTFSEPLDPNQNFADSMTVRNNTTDQTVEGNYSLNAAGNVLTFTPNQPLAADTYYNVNLQGYLDLAGNEGYSFGSYFVTVDTTGPNLQTNLFIGGEHIELNNAQIYSKTPGIYVYCGDEFSDIDESSITFMLDGTVYPLPNTCRYATIFTPQLPLAIGTHTVSLQVSDTRGNTSQISGTFEIIPDAGLPFAVENDTVLLWHLDDISCYEACVTSDAGPYRIGMNYYSYADRVAGRFEGGGKDVGFETSGNTQILNFGSTSFTLEGWMNYHVNPENPQTSPYIIWSRGITSQKEYSLTLQPNGDLQAKVFNASGTTWQTTLSKTTFDVTDGQWHSVAMVVERGASDEQNQLKIYVDGQMRMSSQAPGNFGAVRNTNGQLRLGSGTLNGLKLDEFRVSSSARTAEQILKNFDRQAMGLVVLRSLPNVIQQGGTSQLTLEGYNLDEISATITGTDGSIIPVSVALSGATPISANLTVTTDASVPLGDVLLNLNSGGWAINVPLRVVNQQPFNPETGTVLLWHLDEPNGYTITDAGPYGINGTSYSDSVEGRFGMTRQYDVRANTNSSVLSFGTNEFTVEGWFKWDGYYDGNIFGKGDIESNSEAFVLGITSGAIRGRLRDSVQNIWEAKTNPQMVGMRDGKWHYVAMVVRRGAAAVDNRLLIYVDGVERANTQAPASFGSLRNTTQTFFAGGSYTVTDDVRILNFPRTAEQIAETWFGASEGFASFSTAGKNNKKTVANKNITVKNTAEKPDTQKVEEPASKPVPSVGEQSLLIRGKKKQSSTNR